MGYIKIVSVLLLLAIAFFDFKDRAIPIILYIILTLVIVLREWLFNSQVIFEAIFNILLVGIQLLIAVIWFKYRRKGKQFFKEAFGLGDVWILLISAFYLETMQFVWVLLISGILSFVYSILFNKKDHLIPFAGIISVLLCIYLIVF